MSTPNEVTPLYPITRLLLLTYQCQLCGKWCPSHLSLPSELLGSEVMLVTRPVDTAHAELGIHFQKLDFQVRRPCKMVASSG